jgi:peptide-methionine (S)-S-oxide reductase
MWFLNSHKTRMPAPGEALPGRPTPIPTADRHFVNATPLAGPVSASRRGVAGGP